MVSADVLLYDTTLRDGTQGEQINFTAEEKLRIARRLDDNGFHYIEGGWPGSNPKDMRFFELAKEAEFVLPPSAARASPILNRKIVPICRRL
jgi:isopropylmalate/homocitrate/citramalate synthase